MRIPIAKESLARQLILQGTTTRNVGRMAGLGRMTAWRLSKLVLRGQPLPKCQCGRLAKHIGMCSYRLSRCVSYLARQPRHEAEIDLLTRRAEMTSLDTGGHEFIGSGQLDPLELLMRKEDNEFIAHSGRG